MLKYIVRRIFIFIPTLVAITLLGFIIMVSAPGDPVERMVVAAQSGGEIGSQTANLKEQKIFWKKKLGLDLPIFYFSLSSLAAPDTLYKVYDRSERESLQRFVRRYGNWEDIHAYFGALQKLDQHHTTVDFQEFTDSTLTINQIREVANQSLFESKSLKATYNEEVIAAKFATLETLYQEYHYLNSFMPYYENVVEKFEAMRENATPWKNYIPAIKFYPQNQYHRWIFGDGHWITGKGSVYTRGLVRGDFGTSYITKQPISDVIYEKIGWSLMFTLISVILGYLVSIPLGIKAAVNKDSRFDRISTVGLFILYSLPSFFVATLLLMTFANPDVIRWFPASGVMPATGYPEGASFFEKVQVSLPYLILPMICYTYSTFAFLSRTMRVSMLEIVNQDYIRTARAKGLKERKVIYKHGLRNALLPIITLFANIFPLAIGGSVILETIFTIPGMGREIFVAITNNNYPMIIAVFTITGMLTLVGYLVSDILYAVADPRISYSKN